MKRMLSCFDVNSGGTDRRPLCLPRVSGRKPGVWIAMLVLGCVMWGMPAAGPVRAQVEEEELKTAPKVETLEESETLEEPELSAEPPSGSLAESPGPASSRSEEPTERSLLDTLIDGGVVGLLIVLLSVVSLGFIIEHSLSIRRNALIPEEVASELGELIEQGKVDAAIEASEDPNNESLVADVVQAGLRRYKSSDFGFAEYKAAVEEAGEDQTGRLYRKTEVLGVIGAIAPMLGLTGTVLGMIEAFNKIAATGGTARPDELAGGIGKALVTTLMGLIVAIPTMIAFSFFRNKIDSIVAEAGKRVEQIMAPLGRRRQD